MADISVTAPGGIPLTIKQSPTGELYAVSSNYPGAAGNGSGGPGNFGSGLITTETLNKGIAEVDVLIKDRLEFVSQCKGNLIKLQLNPTAVLGTGYEKASYDFYVNQQLRWIEAGEQFIRSEQSIIETMTYLRDNQDSIKASYAQVNPDSNIKGATKGPDVPDTQSNSNEDTPAKTTGASPVTTSSDPSLNTGDGEAATNTQEQKSVDDGSDPYVNTTTGDSTIAPQVDNVDPYVDTVEGTSTIARQDVIDDGSDPYVSNGVTTVPLPEPQKTVPESPTGPAYDDNGNLMPGWTLNENNDPVWVGGGFVEPATQASAASSRAAAVSTKTGTTAVNNTRSQATQQDLNNFYATGDWRVRLSLAPSANYLYKNKGNEGILLPLAATNGILFPYTPAISVNYAAHYDPFDLTHSNYKAFQYKSSSVDQVSITCDFTAQDTFEANYLLAVIHFLRSVTKMFYGKDSDPINGTPPPLCYLTGLGSFQFDRHPLAVTSFNYTLPTDVDYIRATSTPTNNAGQTSNNVASSNSATQQTTRTSASKVPVGGQKAMPDWKQIQSGSKEPTYVPTKMQIQIQAVPIVSRNDISRRFSLKEYGTGKLLRGSKNNTGGIW